MGEFNPFEIDEFTWDVLKVYIKYGYGGFKLYQTTFFNNLTDETACLTLDEFYEKAVDFTGKFWTERSKEE
jgi:hypothetical protein